ncbi:MAG: hypothetical protein AB7F86_01785 [Bdellovibrionales bacterium]
MKTTILSFVLALGLGFSFGAQADHHGKGEHGKMMGKVMPPMKEPTKEERTKMAEMHTKMAACLGTDKPFADCHKEMADSCPMKGGDGMCPMMGMGGPHHGMKIHGKGMPMGKGKGKPGETEKTSE